jgi:Gas vesicle synthesis protein GvpL/GvpF
VSVLCVYALTSRGEGAVGVSGLAGERLRRVRSAGLDVIVGFLPEEPRVKTSAVRRYDAIMRALAVRHEAILPSRFGTCLADTSELQLALCARRNSVRAALRLVRNRVQMTVRMFGPAQRAVSGSATRARSGAEYLRTRAAAIASEHEIEAFTPLRAAVRRWVRAERVEAHQHGTMLGSVYHLIPRAAAGAYQRAIERAALDAHVTTIISGPWPPYAFAPGLDI